MSAAAVVALLGSAAAAAGDAGTPGPPPATITTSGDVTTELLIDSIDGERVRKELYGALTRFELSAGRHELGISRHTPVPGTRRMRSTYTTMCIEAAPGHAYTARALEHADGSWTPIVFDTATNAQIATTCASPPGPIVAQDGVADGARPDTATAVPTAAAPGAAAPVVVSTGEDDRRDRPGTGVSLRTGVALGGDTLIGGRLASGDELYLNAGAGWTLAVGGRGTPFWLRRRFGFGAALELGFKYDTIRAANGSASFWRFPVLATAHVLARLSRRWYGRLAAGVEKHLDSHYTSDGVFGTGDVSLDSRLSPVGEVGLYRLFRRGAGGEAALRYSRVRYGLGETTIDGTSVGLMLAFHFDL